jgi:hypothetical protein
MNKIIIALLFVIFVHSKGYSQTENNNSNFDFNPQIRSIQFEASSIIVHRILGASIDYDLFSNHKKKSGWFSLGLRAGADFIWKNKLVESYDGSPFTHINGLIRFSSEDKNLRFDAYGGGAYQFATENYDYINREKLVLKGGLNVKVKLNPYVGLFANGAISTGESYLGLGLVISLNSY